MFGAVRLGDWVAGVCSNPSGPFITGSQTTMTDNLPAIRLGDLSTPGPAITGSHAVFIDMRPAVRIIDEVACGRITQASTTTFIW